MKSPFSQNFDDVLYIIGNGFDLHHGVMSSYKSFKIWLQRKNPALHRKLESVCHADFLWKDFESALAYVNRDYFLSAGELMIPQSWTEDDSVAELLYAGDHVRYEAEYLWTEITKWFRKWVQTIQWYDRYNEKKLWIDLEARFITFNYTPFLETQYGIPHENILYIHGKQSDKKHPPVIGHDGRDTFDDWYQKAGRSSKRNYRGKYSYLPEVEMMTEAVEEYFSLSEKPINSIMSEFRDYFSDLYDVRHIYILGHSLGSVDIPYFSAINSANDCPSEISWHVSYYSRNERDSLEQCLRSHIMDKEARLEMFQLSSIMAKS